MVANQQVKLEEKHGNDQADVAAEKGTDEAQPMLKLFANFYHQKRHDQHTKFMERIQQIIVQTKKAEKQMWTDKAKEANPSKDKNVGKVLIPKTLKYEHNMGHTMMLKMGRPRRKEYDEDKSWVQATKVASFLSQTRWCAGEEEAARGTPGITWIEFYLLYKSHEQNKM